MTLVMSVRMVGIKVTMPRVCVWNATREDSHLHVQRRRQMAARMEAVSAARTARQAGIQKILKPPMIAKHAQEDGT